MSSSACPCCAKTANAFRSFAESLARAIEEKKRDKNRISKNVVALKTTTTTSMVALSDAEKREESLLLEDEASCVQRWLSFEHGKRDELLRREIELYRKLIQRELSEEGGSKNGPKATTATAFLQLQLDGRPDAGGDADGTVAHTGGEGGEEEAATTATTDDEAETYDVDMIDPKEWMVPPQCIPVHANVTTFDWKPMYEHTKFDVIMMDPPWQLATANPTRGVSLGYSQLTDADIANLPIPELQENGFLFVWVINAKYQWCLNQFKKWGYEFVDEIAWVKVTNSRRLAKSHGFYLQHAKEVCLVARRGKDPPGTTLNGKTASDVIFAARRGQSQKPTEIYELIEQLVPNGKYLEIFARKNNLRDYWVSVGNEVTGTGLPPEDVKAFAEVGAVPAAKYGAAAQK